MIAWLRRWWRGEGEVLYVGRETIAHYIRRGER